MRTLWTRLRTLRAEVATGAVMVLGWLLITAGIAAIARPRVVWPVSIGLLCCSLAGWELLYTIARHGLYALNQPDSGGKR